MKIYFTFLFLLLIAVNGFTQPPQPIRQIKEYFDEDAQMWRVKAGNAIVEYGYDRLLDETGKRRVSKRQERSADGKLYYLGTTDYHASGISRINDFTTYHYTSNGSEDFTNIYRYYIHRTFNEQDQVTERTIYNSIRDGQTNQKNVTERQERYEYTANGCFATIAYFNRISGDTTWLPSRRIDYQYTDDCRILSEISNRWDDVTEEWQAEQVDTYAYNDRGDLIAQKYDVQANGDFAYQDSILYEYSEDGSYQMQTLRIEGDGVLTQRITEQFDRQARAIVYEAEIYDREAEKWIPFARQFTEYDANDNLTHIEDYVYWDAELNDFSFQEEVNYIYDGDLLLGREFYREELYYDTNAESPAFSSLAHTETFYQRDCTGRLEQEQTIFLRKIKRGVEVPTANLLKERTRYEYIRFSECIDFSESPYNIRFYPNPTTDVVRIDGAPDFADADAFIQLLHSDGRLISTQPIQYAYENEISLRGLPSGVYLIRMVNGANSRIQKVYKN